MLCVALTLQIWDCAEGVETVEGFSGKVSKVLPSQPSPLGFVDGVG